MLWHIHFHVFSVDADASDAFACVHSQRNRENRRRLVHCIVLRFVYDKTIHFPIAMGFDGKTGANGQGFSARSGRGSETIES